MIKNKLNVNYCGWKLLTAASDLAETLLECLLYQVAVTLVAEFKDGSLQ